MKTETKSNLTAAIKEMILTIFFGYVLIIVGVSLYKCALTIFIPIVIIAAALVILVRSTRGFTEPLIDLTLTKETTMQNLRQEVVTLELIETTESKLIRMKDLKEQIKILQAEFDMLKGQVIDEYFNDHQKYVNSKGLCLAEYSMANVNQFQSTRFKKDHPEMYETYTEQTIQFRFLIK